MKKTVLALAVLGAFAGVASAQSSVTLYGRLDTTVVYADRDDGDSVVSLNGNQPIGGSRWGLRGSEDLGGGLRVNFMLESGINSDTGASASSTKLFDRQAWVSLVSANLGEVRMGRQDTLTRQLNQGFAGGDVSAEGEINTVDTLSGLPLFQNLGNRVDNSVGYYSPSFGGLVVRALVGAGEGTTARQQGLMIGYAAGPIKAGVAYEEYTNSPVGGDDSYNQVFTVAGSYNFGVAILGLSYQDTSDFGDNNDGSDSGIDHEAYNVGVMVPLGSFELRAQYTKSEVDFGPGDKPEQEKYGISVRYSMSKRTQLYAGWLERDSDESPNPSAVLKETEVFFGIGHNF